MKIIHLLLGKANPLRMNGVNKVAYELARAQHAVGEEVSVWGITANPVHDYPQRSFTTRLFAPSRWGISAELRRSVESLPQDAVVHIHGVFIPLLDKLARLLKQRSVAYIITPHGALAKGAMERNKWQKQIYFQLVTRPILRGAASVQTLGEAESSDLFDLAPEVHQVMIPNGQDLAEIPRLQERQPNAVPVFGFCGRMDAYHKGLDLLLQAFRDLIANGTAARLLLIGDGADRPKLEQYCQDHGLHEFVEFVGARYGAEKYTFLHQADFFVHTSRMEGFPVAVLEAAGLGLPPITTPPTSMNRYLRRYDAGLPVNEVSVPAISRSLAQACALFNSLEHEGLRRNARWMIGQAFDWADIAEKLVRVYHRALKPQNELFGQQPSFS